MDECVTPLQVTRTKIRIPVVTERDKIACSEPDGIRAAICNDKVNIQVVHGII